MILKQIRRPDNGVETLGDYFLEDDDNKIIFTCKTLELPFKGNQHEISCIPADDYICKKVLASSNIPYPHISITNVPGRSGVCIHIANFVSELRGCQAVGTTLNDLNKDGQPDLVASKKTFEKLISLLPNTFVLSISYSTENINV